MMHLQAQPDNASSGIPVDGSRSASDLDDHAPLDEPKQAHMAEHSIPVGSLSSIQNLYAGPADRCGRYTWSATVPSSIPEAAENDETARHALVVRQTQSFDSRRSLDLHSIIVQSPYLKFALENILKGYPGVSCKLARLEFTAPFEPFIHRWEGLQMLRNRLACDYTPNKDEDVEFHVTRFRAETREHLNLLFDILSRALKDTIQALEDFKKHGVADFQELWTIFQPGALVVSDHSGTLSAYEFVSGQYGRDDHGKLYRLRLNSVAWDGVRFGRHSSFVSIREFKGTKQVTSLHTFPLALHPDQEALKERFIQRGRKAEGFAGSHYEAYDGLAVAWDEEGETSHVMINGRIVVNTQSFNHFNPSDPIVVGLFKGTDEVSVFDDKQHESGAFANPDHLMVSNNNAPRMRFSESLYLVSHPLVYGYSLKAKKWVGFFIDFISPIRWNEDAFSSLVLPPDQKDMIMSFALTQSKGKTSFDDVISGKGRGINILLSGPPGVGKTLTAESVAEAMKVPLYSLTAGDLGLHPKEIETELGRIVDMVTKWGAVLLLDECDIFLEARSAHDLERNKVVSIFLKTLEYFEGIFVLTSNRLDDLDLAFRSRTHVSMAYPLLDAAARKKVWGNFLNFLDRDGKTVLEHELTEQDLDELSQEELNGREIKNVLKTAQLLVTMKGGLLRREIIETVLAIGKEASRIGH